MISTLTPTISRTISSNPNVLRNIPGILPLPGYLRNGENSLR
jgi:hypothetical protein